MPVSWSISARGSLTAGAAQKALQKVFVLLLSFSVTLTRATRLHPIQSVHLHVQSENQNAT